MHPRDLEVCEAESAPADASIRTSGDSLKPRMNQKDIAALNCICQIPCLDLNCQLTKQVADVRCFVKAKQCEQLALLKQPLLSTAHLRPNAAEVDHPRSL